MSGIDRTGVAPYLVCTSTSRPSSPLEGQTIYESDTTLMLSYDGSNWQSIIQSGSVVQTVYVRSDTQTSYAANASGNGTTMSELGLTITPRYASSIILCDWMINGEIDENGMFLVHKNGVLQTSPAGYNSVTGNSIWSGIASGRYDQNQDSTQANWKIMYIDTSLLGTSSRTYAPAIRNSNANSTFYLNRTVNAASQAAYERTVSIGIAREIKQ